MALEGLGADHVMFDAALTATEASSTAAQVLNLKESGANVVGGVSPAAPGVTLEIDFDPGTTSNPDILVDVSDDGGTTWWRDPDYSTLAVGDVNLDRQIVVKPLLAHETDVRVSGIDNGATPTGNNLRVVGRLQDMRKVTTAS